MISGSGMRFLPFPKCRNSCGAHLASYPISTRKGIAARTWNWQLTSI